MSAHSNKNSLEPNEHKEYILKDIPITSTICENHDTELVAKDNHELSLKEECFMDEADLPKKSLAQSYDEPSYDLSNPFSANNKSVLPQFTNPHSYSVRTPHNLDKQMTQNLQFMADEPSNRSISFPKPQISLLKNNTETITNPYLDDKFSQKIKYDAEVLSQRGIYGAINYFREQGLFNELSNTIGNRDKEESSVKLETSGPQKARSSIKIDLTQYNKKGKKMTPKEIFKRLSWKFHGTRPKTKKKTKLIKKGRL